ncbi:ATP-dependent nuclease [Sphingobium vermicomposti]|uniref:Putative ATP-dependent endonuclease of OLD family n=1 Tax=Sphingobium vermicomposti TaxID=529005 RepID=A0A846MDZ7_9SPHN|nr:AAA family ATPase [Sphingobium vermicomposti]NIJ16025.1 putative ATP-dependent endonuclease of OLD family [Sphingobium vermicomposti]
MRVVRVYIENFRGIRLADLHFEGTTVLLGDNNTGKSTVFEAIELAMGADRLSRTQAIDEHDFHGGRYLAQPDQPAPKIVVEVIVAGLDQQHCDRFRANLEFWHTASRSLIGPGRAAQAGQAGVEPAVRIRFEGAYDPDGDEFTAKTWFAVPHAEDGTPTSECRSSDKREFGFLHLRALRTGSRALSMERGSLLDVILKTYEVRTRMWEGLLDNLRGLDVVGANDPEFGRILTAIQEAMREIVPGEWADAPHLRVSELTREDLRRVLKSFLATGVPGYAAPFQHQGSGTINALVLAMLGLIAERRNGRVIFAMEEPEISLPPHVQQRVVDKVRGLASQALFTSHSPYVIEQFQPEQMTVMRRDQTALLTATAVILPQNLRLKIFRDGFRTRFCEALLARRVLVVEGKTEFVSYSAVSRRAAELQPGQHKRLDSLGWVPFDAGGETAVASFAAFFRGLGKTVATIFDRQNPGAAAGIQLACDRAFEQPYAGFEHLLRDEVAPAMQRWFVQWLVDEREWPAALAGQVPPDGSPDAAYSVPFLALFKHKKGDDYLTLFFSQCQMGHFPQTMTQILGQLRAMVEAPPPPPVPLPPIPQAPIPPMPGG